MPADPHRTVGKVGVDDAWVIFAWVVLVGSNVNAGISEFTPPGPGTPSDPYIVYLRGRVGSPDDKISAEQFITFSKVRQRYLSTPAWTTCCVEHDVLSGNYLNMKTPRTTL